MTPYLVLKDGNFSVQKTTGFKPANAIAVVPESIDKSDYKFITGVEVDDGNGGTYWQAQVDETAKGLAISENQKVENRKAARVSYIADIDQEMTNIYGTTDRDKASSMYLTWQLWRDDPSFLSDKGLIDEHGEPLDTASKISIYAIQKIDQCKDYSVFLMTREKQYKDELALIDS